MMEGPLTKSYIENEVEKRMNHVFGIVARPKSNLQRREYKISHLNEDTTISASVQKIDSHN